MANLKSASRTSSPTRPRTRQGIKQGNATGNYEKQPGHLPDGTSTAERSTGHQRRGRASRSTRGCRTCSPA